VSGIHFEGKVICNFLVSLFFLRFSPLFSVFSVLKPLNLTLPLTFAAPTQSLKTQSSEARDDFIARNPYRNILFQGDFTRFDSRAEKFEAWRSFSTNSSSSDGNEDILMATKLSARNKIEGKIVELEVDGVMAHVAVQVGKNLIESIITRRSAEEMKLKVGDRVSAVIKSTEVMLQKG
jgi:molybdopterin-binding protein